MRGLNLEKTNTGPKTTRSSEEILASALSKMKRIQNPVPEEERPELDQEELNAYLEHQEGATPKFKPDLTIVRGGLEDTKEDISVHALRLLNGSLWTPVCTEENGKMVVYRLKENTKIEIKIPYNKKPEKMAEALQKKFDYRFTKEEYEKDTSLQEEEYELSNIASYNLRKSNEKKEISVRQSTEKLFQKIFSDEKPLEVEVEKLKDNKNKTMENTQPRNQRNGRMESIGSVSGFEMVPARDGSILYVPQKGQIFEKRTGAQVKLEDPEITKYRKELSENFSDWELVSVSPEKISVSRQIDGESAILNLNKKTYLKDIERYEKTGKVLAGEKSAPEKKESISDKIFNIKKEMTEASKNKNFGLLTKLRNELTVLENKQVKEPILNEKPVSDKKKTQTKEVNELPENKEDQKPAEQRYALASELKHLTKNLGWQDEKLLTFFQMNKPEKLILAAKRNQMFSEADREEAIAMGFEDKLSSKPLQPEENNTKEGSSMEEAREPISFKSFDLDESDKAYQELVGRNFKEPFPQTILNSIAQKIYDGYKLTSAEKTLYSYTEIKDEIDILRETIQETELEKLTRRKKELDELYSAIEQEIERRKKESIEDQSEKNKIDKKETGIIEEHVTDSTKKINRITTEEDISTPIDLEINEETKEQELNRLKKFLESGLPMEDELRKKHIQRMGELGETYKEKISLEKVQKWFEEKKEFVLKQNGKEYRVVDIHAKKIFLKDTEGNITPISKNTFNKRVENKEIVLKD